MTESPLQSSTMPVAYDNVCDFSEWVELKIDSAKFDGLIRRARAAQNPEGETDLQRAQDRILRATAFETGAVEDLYSGGATYSVAMEVDGWEADLANSGDGAGQHFEDQLAAYVAVRDLAVKDSGRPFLEIDIRGLHSIATRSQRTYPVQTPIGMQDQPFVPGAYKTKPNQVINRAGRVFQYAPVEDVAPEMERLVATMRSEEFIAAHPVIQCAYVHWAVAHIHPFADGNGRMARVIGSIPLLKAFGIPLVVFAGRKRLYLQALEAADRHGHQEMVDYIETRVAETYSWLAELIEGAKAEDEADSIMANISHLLNSEAETLETSMEAAQRLEKTMLEALKMESSKKFAGTKVRCEVVLSHGLAMSKGYKRAHGFREVYQELSGEIQITLSADEVAKHATMVSIQFGYTDVLGNPPLVIEHDIGDEDVFFSLEDCSPDLSVGVELRMRLLAAAVITDAAKKFNGDLAGIYRQHGRLPSEDS